MGRPLNKRYFGTTANDLVGDDKSSEGKLSINCKVTGQSISQIGIIVSQRSETKFRVNDAADGSGNEGVCTLVDKAPGSLADGEMTLQGYIDGETIVNIRKVQNRTMLDFDNNRYTWEIQDDSTTNILALTRI